MTDWVPVATVDEVPSGGRKLCDVAGQRIAVFCIDDDRFVAIENRCPHQSGPVAAGEIDSGVITCPWHGLQFHLADGQCLTDSTARLRQMPVKVEGGSIFIDASPPAEGQGIFGFLVRYGKPSFVGRFGSISSVEVARGQAVVVQTDRGMESGTLLKDLGPLPVGSAKPAGELLRLATDEDVRTQQASERDGAKLVSRVLTSCDEILQQRGISVAVVDAEQLFDQQTVIVYYLGVATAELGPVAVELSETFVGHRIQFQVLEDMADVGEETPEAVAENLSRRDRLKFESDWLAGDIAKELTNSSESFSSQSSDLLEFHGVYPQKLRPEFAPTQSSLVHTLMVRTRITGGRLSSRQLLTQLDLAKSIRSPLNGIGLRVTSRQGLQLHGVAKGDVRAVVAAINDAMMTTFGACGDVQRNVMCCPAPSNDPIRNQVQRTASDLARQLSPRSSAYHRIWLDGLLQQPDDDARNSQDLAVDENVEPTYGATYLPHKFKTAVGLPDDNCVDVFAQDVGLLAIVEAGQVAGYNVLVGGGMGSTVSNLITMPRLAQPVCFIPYSWALHVVTAIIQLYRDHGPRNNRKKARLKYLVADWGIERFLQELQVYLPKLELVKPREVAITAVHNHLGWQSQGAGRCFFGLTLPAGRIVDVGRQRYESAIREICEQLQPPIRLTAQQNLIFCNLDSEQRKLVNQILVAHGIDPNDLTSSDRDAMACPAMPTCGLAVAEAERVMPELLASVDQAKADLGIDIRLNVRITGCPNGCARPYSADIGLVGTREDCYTLFVGGDPLGQRLGFVLVESKPLGELRDVIRQTLTTYTLHRNSAEQFSDFCVRLGKERLLLHLDETK